LRRVEIAALCGCTGEDDPETGDCEHCDEVAATPAALAWRLVPVVTAHGAHSLRCRWVAVFCSGHQAAAERGCRSDGVRVKVRSALLIVVASLFETGLALLLILTHGMTKFWPAVGFSVTRPGNACSDARPAPLPGVRRA